MSRFFLVFMLVFSGFVTALNIASLVNSSRSDEVGLYAACTIATVCCFFYFLCEIRSNR